MRRFQKLLRRQGKRMFALMMVIGLFWFTRLPALSSTERSTLASHYQFTQLPLPEVPGPALRSTRSVNPSLERLSGWIAAVGAAVALNDLDGDGLPNDVCYLETRTNQVIVAPVPGTPKRYQPFELETAASLYEPTTMAPMGCLPGDINEDGYMDLVVYYWGRTPIAFLNQSTPENKAQLTSNNYVQQEILSGGASWYTNAATLADVDGDGHNDLIVGNFFADNTQILDAKATSTTEVMQHSLSRGDNGGRHHLLHWTGATTGENPAVQFQEVRGALNESEKQPWALAVGAADLDGDQLPEIYFANDFGPDRLLHNRSQPGVFKFSPLKGKKTLTTPNSKVLGNDSFKGMGIDFGDVNSDGWMDIFVSNIAAEYSLEESHFLFASTGQIDKMKRGVAPYIDHSESLGLSRYGWGWDTKFGDFNNDGTLEALLATGFLKGDTDRWPEMHELAMGNDELLSHDWVWPRFQTAAGDDLSGHQHNPFFVRAADGRFYDLATELQLGEPFVTRGIATADVDGDGDLDFVFANQWEPSFFFRNDNPQQGNFLGLHLLLPTGSTIVATTMVEPGHPRPSLQARPAIGASARVLLPDGRHLVAQVDGGNGHSGVRSPDLHFGLGELTDNTSVPVDLQWRDSQGQVHQESLLVSPGWHTVLLGNSAKSAPSLS